MVNARSGSGAEVQLGASTPLSRLKVGMNSRRRDPIYEGTKTVKNRPTLHNRRLFDWAAVLKACTSLPNWYDFLLDSGTPNIAISRSANYYERSPQYNEHPMRLNSLWNVDTQCSFPVSRRSIWRILNFTVDIETRRVNCFDQADQGSKR